ncbi:tetratricopeptide repeat protein [Salinisphaera sp. T5B8]|uniref:tetratricopeptide repeat protein n=1 Tax=Salinisphaera sp. T5B8 TaxID=1304154 RepID=UPI003342A3B5
MKDQLEKMLAAGEDNALLRFSLGELLYKEGRPAEAAEHLGEAVAHDPDYSAAWKLYGRALVESGDLVAGLDVLEHGITVAEARGDNQAAREMQVFAKRARKQQTAGD